MKGIDTCECILKMIVLRFKPYVKATSITYYRSGKPEVTDSKSKYFNTIVY
jgi:hypothetical protein